MKYIKLFEEFNNVSKYLTNVEDIKEWLDDNVKDAEFKIVGGASSDDEIEHIILNGAYKPLIVTGDRYIPFDFNDIEMDLKYGYLKISDSNLTTLKGCPSKVHGLTIISCQYLENLKGCPHVSTLHVRGCESLKNLIGCQTHGLHTLECSNCKILTSLEGCPRLLNGNFGCSDNPSLISLEYGPTEVNGQFYCHGCSKLKNLVGCPQYVKTNFSLRYNEFIESLKGCPTYIGGEIILRNLPELVTVYHSPKYVEDISWNLVCSDVYLELGYSKDNHNDLSFHFKAAYMQGKDKFFKFIDSFAPEELIDVMVKTILENPESGDVFLNSNLPDTIKSELKYAVNLSKSDVKAKNIFD